MIGRAITQEGHDNTALQPSPQCSIRKKYTLHRQKHTRLQETPHYSRSHPITIGRTPLLQDAAQYYRFNPTTGHPTNSSISWN